MQVNKNISQEILEDAGENRVQKAKRYVNEGRVNIYKTNYEDKDNFSISSIVSGNNDDYEVEIEVKDGDIDIESCECADYRTYYGACKHIVATLMKFEQTKYWDNEAKLEETKNKPRSKNEQYKYRSFSNLVSSFYNEELKILSEDETVMLANKDKIKLETKIEYDKFTNTMKLELRLGNKRMYKIKDLPEFYTRMINNEYFKYGERLEFVHNRENFDEESKPLLDFILRYAEIMKYSNSSDRYGYYSSSSINKAEITLGEGIIDEVYDLLKKQAKVNFVYDYENYKLEFIEQNPKIEFELSKIDFIDVIKNFRILH